MIYEKYFLKHDRLVPRQHGHAEEYQTSAYIFNVQIYVSIHWCQQSQTITPCHSQLAGNHKDAKI